MTLTYNNENLPPSLSKKALQLFFKRFRGDLKPGQRIKYFACGEYGEKFGRPHYHAIVFGVGLSDPVFRILRVTPQGTRLKCDAWPYGFMVGGSVTYESARYVAGYVQKKLRGAEKLLYGTRLPPFQLQSQGIGMRYAETHADELVRELGIRQQGLLYSMPRYYRKKLGDRITEEMLEEKRAKRESERLEELQKLGIAPEERSDFEKRCRSQKAAMVHERARRWKERSF